MRWTSFQQLIVLPNTLFGLPWLITSVAMALADPLMAPAGQSWVWLGLWMTIAFIAARIAGMSFNRLIDQSFDALNPRTRDRVLPKGEVTRQQVTCVAWGSVAVFVVACGAINLTCLALAPILVALLWGYSYLKRITPLCHVVMALNHFFIPIFVWAALTGAIGIPALYLGGAILCLVTANDIVYGIQDLSFDRSHRLHSVATALGPERALWLTQGLHALFLLMIIDLAMLLDLAAVFYLGVLIIAGVLFYLHRRYDKDGDATAFMFRCNVWVGGLLMLFSVGAVIWQKSL